MVIWSQVGRKKSCRTILAYIALKAFNKSFTLPSTQCNEFHKVEDNIYQQSPGCLTIKIAVILITA